MVISSREWVAPVNRMAGLSTGVLLGGIDVFEERVVFAWVDNDVFGWEDWFF